MDNDHYRNQFYLLVFEAVIFLVILIFAGLIHLG